MYYWITANDNTGSIGASSGTHSPDSALAPTGFTLVGPYDDMSNPMPADFKAAYDNPSEYLYQNNAFVSNPNYDSLQLSNAKQSKIAELQTRLNQTLVGGFASKATGHTYVTTEFGEANMHGDLTRFSLDNTLASVQFYTVDAGWIDHTQAQIQGAFLDGGKWKDAQYVQFNSLVNQVKSATTVSGVEAVTWAPATY